MDAKCLRQPGLHSSARQSGQTLSEVPIVLFVLLLLVLFPVIDLACITYRSTFVDGAARNAAHVGCKAHTFRLDSEEGQSATTLVRAEVARSLASFPGIRVTRVTPRIVRTSLQNPSDRQVFEAPLPAVPNPNEYTYQLEVEVKAEVAPLVTFTDLLGQVPGLSEPLPVTATAREVFESVFWLTR